MTSFLLLIFFVGIMYFMIIRPQRKRDKEVAAMRSSLKRGDKIVTIGGIVGTIVKVGEETITIQVGADRVKLEMLKSSVANITKASDAAPAKAKKEEPSEEESIPNRTSDKKVTPKKLVAKKKTDEASEDAEA